MAGVKPNEFAIRSVLDGTEELYTQTNGVNQKFTVDQLSQLVAQQAGKIICLPLAEFSTFSSSYVRDDNPVVVPDPSVFGCSSVQAMIIFTEYIEFDFHSMFLRLEGFNAPYTSAIEIEQVAAGDDSYPMGISDWFDIDPGFYVAAIRQSGGGFCTVRLKLGSVLVLKYQ
jgi:hypothetical protein